MAVSYTGKQCKYCANAGVVEFDGLCGSCQAELRTNYSEHLWCRFCGRANIRDRDSDTDLICGMPVCEQTRRGELSRGPLDLVIRDVAVRMSGIGNVGFSMKLIR